MMIKNTFVSVIMGLIIAFLAYITILSLLPFVYPELEQEGGEGNIYAYRDPNNPGVIMYYDEPIQLYPNGTVIDKDSYVGKIIKHKQEEDKDEDEQEDDK